MLIIALASGAFGGTVAALATAAIQSQADPQAIAAAVQRVQDTKAERALDGMSQKLGQILANSRGMANGVKAAESDAKSTATDVHSIVGQLDPHSYFGYPIAGNLRQICKYTGTTAGLVSPFCP